MQAHLLPIGDLCSVGCRVYPLCKVQKVNVICQGGGEGRGIEDNGREGKGREGVMQIACMIIRVRVIRVDSTRIYDVTSYHVHYRALMNH